jgi:hypothetical protein
MLRAGKKAKPMKEEEQVEEGTYKPEVEKAFPSSGVRMGAPAPKGTSTMPKDKEKAKGQSAGRMSESEDLAETKSAPKGHHFTRSGQLKRGDADQDGPGGPMLRSDPKDKMRSKIPPVSEDNIQVDEAGMPSSVARHKQNIANMSDKEFAQKYSHLDTKGLRSMAWSHMGTKRGGPGTPGHDHYVNKMAKGKAQLANEEVYLDDADETIFVHAPIEYQLQESYNFGDYLTAAKSIVGEDDAIELANEAFNNQDTNIFVEQFLRSDIEAKVKAHQKMGHKVSTPKYSTKSGQPHAEYVVTDKEGMRRKYIHHGSNRKMENMGPVGKRDEE